jgi:hypothetical protein
MNINSMPVLVVEAISPEKASQMRIHNWFSLFLGWINSFIAKTIYTWQINIPLTKTFLQLWVVADQHCNLCLSGNTRGHGCTLMMSTNTVI